MNPWIWQHDLDPILVELGPLRVGWYGLMYAVSFLVFYWVMVRAGRKEGALIPAHEVSNLLTYVIVGVIVGGRLGWVIFYGGPDYLYEPWRVFETWKGGMSFHGGMLGVILASLVYCRRHGISLVEACDYAGIWAPMGLFLGRIGNFINGELYGKPTDGSWGVIFPADPHAVPRHPSQLYEALGEGVLLFLLMWAAKRGLPLRGLQPALFLLGYGTARILAELIRLPDDHIGYLFYGSTMGQWLSVPMFCIGLVWVAVILGRRFRTRTAAA